MDVISYARMRVKKISERHPLTTVHNTLVILAILLFGYPK